VSISPGVRREGTHTGNACGSESSSLDPVMIDKWKHNNGGRTIRRRAVSMMRVVHG
jgi:hypothetical protein